MRPRTRCQVLGKRENHGVIAAPVRTFGGTTVAEETCQREWCLGASVEDYEELSGSVGACWNSAKCQHFYMSKCS